ncbi:MAG: hypothetical protein ACI8ZM_001936 [Crocinitomix sp.]|jgi:uncharacterized protein
MKKENYIENATGLNPKSVKKTIELLEEGATIPFIARYRKEQTNNLDEVEILNIQNALGRFSEISKRKEYILGVLQEKGIANEELLKKINESFDLNRLEDLYLPYKTKRKTKAEQARTAGLTGLAKIIMKQDNGDPIAAAQRFKHKDYPTAEAAIEGAAFIMADWMNENEVVRERMRASFIEHGVLTSKVVKTKKEQADKFRDFFDFSQRLKGCPSYRLLAALRGNDEGFLRIKIEPNKEYAVSWLERFFVKNSNQASTIVQGAIKDAYKRLLQPALDTETKNHYKALADDQSIDTFSKNLEKLMLAAPVGSKRTLAIDPGFKSGCKVVCLDENGDLLHNCNIYPHPPQKESSKASAKIFQLVQSYKIEVIAIGDGTAGRETEAFIKRVHFDRDLSVFIVREDGASIYSASKIAREEFPSYDITVRGAVSIGRRLMDPLAELVKIDPKSLGIGQYQHDVNQTKLQNQLDHVVRMAVNKVGVNLNTASKYLLAYVSGLGPKLAENIVAHRTANGPFDSRDSLKEVPRLGANAFQQSAGFLRIRNAKNPLDNSAVHPENYKLVRDGIRKAGFKLEDVIGQKDKVEVLKEEMQRLATNDIGTYTLNDILTELEKPGIDPRKSAKIFQFSEQIKTISDLKIGMKVNGIVTNVTDFGAFVNIGIKENGLIHKTQLSDEFVSQPTDYISIHDQVQILIISIDEERKRIGLSLKKSDLAD